MTDYSKWDDMAREEERAEQLEKERKRHENREKYYRDQEERKVKYMKEQEAKKVSADTTNTRQPEGTTRLHVTCYMLLHADLYTLSCVSLVAHPPSSYVCAFFSPRLAVIPMVTAQVTLMAATHTVIPVTLSPSSNRFVDRHVAVAMPMLKR